MSSENQQQPVVKSVADLLFQPTTTTTDDVRTSFSISGSGNNLPSSSHKQQSQLLTSDSSTSQMTFESMNLHQHPVTTSSTNIHNTTTDTTTLSATTTTATVVAGQPTTTSVDSSFNVDDVKPIVSVSNLHTSNSFSHSMDESSSSSQRRSSSRSIKRKKFYDELVESSILTSKGQRGRTLSTSHNPSIGNVAGSAIAPSGSLSPVTVNAAPITTTINANVGKSSQTSTSISNEVAVQSTSTNLIHQTVSTPVGHEIIDTKSHIVQSIQLPPPPPPPPVVESKPVVVTKKSTKPANNATNNRRRLRIAHNNAVKDLGRWKPQDDLALVLAVQQTNDLEAVYRGVKFSCKFTLQEIEQRWYVLLYDPTIAKIGVAAMRQLHPDVVAQIHAKALYSKQEETLLKCIPSSSRPSLDTFQQLLEKHIDVFLQFRTAKALKGHWTLLKHYQLLDDQILPPLSSSSITGSTSIGSSNCLLNKNETYKQSSGTRNEETQSFSDMEEQVEKELIASLPNPSSLFRSEEAINQELMLSNRKCIREIRQLENEIPRWQVLVDSITGVAPSDFDNETLAVLRGRLVRYLMRSREITLGRCTKDSFVDVDLSLEGPSGKISRKQALIKLTANGEFVITNVGKRAFHVDSKPVLGNLSCAKLFNNSVVEIAGLRFVFLVNQDLIAAVRAEALKSHM